MTRNHELWLSNSLGHALGVAVVAASLATYYFAAYQPLAEMRIVSTERIEDLDAIVMRASRIQADHQEVTSSLEEITRRSEAVRKHIPDNPGEAEFLRKVTEAARQEGFILRDYRPGSPSAGDHFSQLDIRLLGEGDYRSICGFLSHLSKMPRICQLQKLEITNKTDAGIYPLDLTLSLFYGLKSSPTESKKGGNG